MGRRLRPQAASCKNFNFCYGQRGPPVTTHALRARKSLTAVAFSNHEGHKVDNQRNLQYIKKPKERNPQIGTLLLPPSTYIYIYRPLHICGGREKAKERNRETDREREKRERQALRFEAVQHRNEAFGIHDKKHNRETERERERTKQQTYRHI